MAGPGTLLASAGNDLNIIGATIQGAGNTALSAGNSVNLGTVQASQSNNVGAGDAKNHLLTSQTSDVGSTVAAGKDLSISAGQNVIAKAADLKAQGRRAALPDDLGYKPIAIIRGACPAQRRRGTGLGGGLARS